MKRALSHHDGLAAEEPLILDPGGGEDPRNHIRFRQELAIGKTCEGRTTVEVIGLNRAGLCEDRLERLGQIRSLQRIIAIWESGNTPGLAVHAKEAQRKLKMAVRQEAKFSAMVADNLSGVA